jgi:hypothetical protein
MKQVIAILIVATLSGSALAGGKHGHGHGHRHGHFSLGFNFGVPLFSPWYYHPAPGYYYPAAPVLMQPPAPAVYVERSDVVPEGPGTWYFCRESNTYYPYVKQCPGGWTRVPAQPPN